MICLSCPNCGSALEFADDLAGFDTYCYACCNPLKVPPASVNPVRPVDPAQATSSPPQTSFVDDWRKEYAASGASVRRSVVSAGSPVRIVTGTRLFLLAIVVLGAVGFYMSGGGIRIYVDNGGKDPIAVTVEGQQEITIAPGQFEVIKCEPGERRIQVRCGQEVLFDGVKDLQKPDKMGTNRRYLFNPDNRNRYRTYTVEYGSNLFEELFRPGQKDPSEDELISAYRELAEEPKLLPPDPWFEVRDVDYVLERPPQSVRSNGFSERRVVMTRVNPKAYSFIEAARKNTNPSESDWKALFEVVNRVLESEP